MIVKWCSVGYVIMAVTLVFAVSPLCHLTSFSHNIPSFRYINLKLLYNPNEVITKFPIRLGSPKATS